MSKKPKWIIKDWAGNILSSDGRFKQNWTAVPKTFKSFDDAEEFLSEKLGDDYETDRGEYYVEEEENH